MSDDRETDLPDAADLADYDAAPDDDADDADGSPLRIDISDDRGPLLTGGGETSDSVAPRPGHGGDAA